MYITETRTYYPDNYGDVEIILYGRTPDGEPERVRVTGFEPYFFVPEEEADTLQPKDHSDLARVNDTASATSIFGDSLARITATHPGGVRGLQEQYDSTFEADVDFESRLRIDHDIYSGIRVETNKRRVRPEELEPVEIDADPRYLYYDIEIDDRGAMPVQGDDVVHTDSEVVTICAYDSYTQEYHGFVSLGDRQPSEVLPTVMQEQEAPGCLDKLHFYHTEKPMLKGWIDFVSEIQPDALLAWNNVGFDAPYLIERANAIGLNPGDMGRGPAPAAGVRRGTPAVTGVAVYDLMKAWSKMQVSDVSSRLNNAASMELGDDHGKIEHEAGIHEMWQDDAEQLLRYNGRDVSLMVDINAEAGIMDDREELKDTVGVDYEDTYQANSFIEMLCRRKLWEVEKKGPDGTPPDGDSGYEGAYTFDAFEGRRQNVVSIDLSSLYPYTMKMLNSSPEQLITHAENPQEYIKQDDRDLTAAPNGAVFSNENDGLFRQVVDEALELTQQAGRLRDQHEPGTEMWNKHNKSREARKRIRNGLYGVLGWVWFFMYDKPVAEAITTLSQRVVKRSAEYINEETPGNVIYGDTDSCYISFPNEWTITESLEETHQIVARLNGVEFPKLAGEWGIDPAESQWEMEIEDASEAMFQANRKKRYAKKSVWKEGMDIDARLDEPEYSIKGFEAKRSDCATLLERLQKETLTMIVDGEPNSEIRDRVFQASRKIDRTDYDPDLIGIPGGIGQPLDEYDSDTAQVRGAKAANDLLNLSLGESDKPKRLYLERTGLDVAGTTVETDVICFEDESDIQPVADQLAVDVARMQEVVVETPMERILSAVDIDAKAAMTGRKQNAIGDYL
jgi:DNA polymerase elongation subunit (family B)